MTRVGQESPDDSDVRSVLEEAAETLRRLPAGLRRPRLTSWPEVVRDSSSLLAPPTEGRTRPAAPTPGAIDRMDEALMWLLACDGEARRLVWARACRVPWRKLEDLDGRSHVTLRKIVSRGHDQIRRHLGRS
ncbi:DUF6362 family protein [Thalassobaculum sp.]|uniref:DUF6362 family protein n=1 Tax=Thalassobaculum sp. TaxID=2022740 RepID=UPI0032ED85B7